MKVSFISTVYNEQDSITEFASSLFNQTKLPDEIVIVDGGSLDRTVSSIKYKVLSIKRNARFKKVKFRVLVKHGNRAVGRNEAIKNATGGVIVCSDAGCVLDKNWLREITLPFRNKNIDVVAGYYKGRARNIFEKCLVPYVLVMPDKVNPKTFLPATRSVAFKKSIWEKIGGFAEEFSRNEDYVFAKRLRTIQANIFFQKNAIVYWNPRKNLKQAFIMFFSFAYGDGEAGIFRTKVLFLLLRYLVGIIVLLIAFSARSEIVQQLLIGLLVLYFVWAIWKNYKFVNDPQAIIILPIIQVTSDISVLSGTIGGVVKKIWGTQKRR